MSKQSAGIARAGRWQRAQAVATLALLLGLLGMLMSCRTSHQYVGSFRKADLAGAVYALEISGAGRSSVAGASVRLDESEPITTDASGRFLISGVRAGTHRIRVSRDGYLTVERELSFLNRSQVVYVRLPSIEWAMQAIAEAILDGDNDEARDLALRVVSVAPRNPVARYALTMVELERGQTERARFHVAQIPGEYADNPHVSALRARVAGSTLRPERSP